MPSGIGQIPMAWLKIPCCSYQWLRLRLAVNAFFPRDLPRCHHRFSQVRHLQGSRRARHAGNSAAAPSDAAPISESAKVSLPTSISRVRRAVANEVEYKTSAFPFCWDGLATLLPAAAHGTGNLIPAGRSNQQKLGRALVELEPRLLPTGPQTH